MRKSILMGLGLALSVAGTAIAQQGQDTQRPPRGERGGERGGRVGGRGGPDGLLLKDITLTEGQRAQIAQLRKAQRDEMETSRGKNRGQSDELRAARQRGDTAAVRKAFEARRQVMEQERARHIAAVRNLLTAEQRVQFDKNVAELKQRQAQRAERGEGVGRGKGRGPKGTGADRAKPFRAGR
jgi:Spy/CpxP family protein refolding chaperone